MSPLGLMTALASALQGPLAPNPALEQFLQRVDTNYPKLVSLRQEIASAIAKEQEKRGAFDPVLSVGTETQRYNSSSNPGKAYETNNTLGGVDVATVSGIKLSVGSRFNTGQVKSPLSSTGELGEHLLTLKIPLIRDLGANEKSIALRQAQTAIPLAERVVSANRLSILRDSANAYWEWVAAGRRKVIAQELLNLARIRERQITTRFEAGDEREITVVEARTEVQRREGALAKADRDVQKAGLKLGLYLWEPGGTPMTFDMNAVAALPPAIDIESPQATIAERRAVEARPEIAALDLSRLVTRLTRDLAQNDRRPALDLTVASGYDAGDGGIGRTYKLGIMYSIPLRQNTADGRIADADAKLRKIELDRQLLVQQVRTEVADAVSAVRQSYLRVQAAQSELALARRLEEMERINFNLGEGTLFLLNQRERATAEAAQREVDVLAEYHQAVAALRAAAAEL